MRLSFEERQELRDSARRILVDRYPIERVREFLDDQRGFDVAVGAELQSMDWSPMALPERLGGYGVAFDDVAVVISELGRALVGGPFVPSAVVAGGALAMGANSALAASVVPSLLDGSAVASAAIAGPRGHYSTAGLGTSATRADGGFVLNGEASFVAEGHVADHFIVVARSGRDVVIALVSRDASGVTVTPAPLVDQTRRFSTVRLDDVAVGDDALLCEPAVGAALLARITELGAMCAAIDSFGLAEVVVTRTADYAKQRFQFGRSIGSFQAIKHKLADAVLLIETSRVAIDFAAEAVRLDQGESDSDALVRIANTKSYACDAAVKICQDAVQIHGGIGFTWEEDTHLYLKRALINQSLYGQSSWHLDRLADAVLPRSAM